MFAKFKERLHALLTAKTDKMPIGLAPEYYQNKALVERISRLEARVGVIERKQL